MTAKSTLAPFPEYLRNLVTAGASANSKFPNFPIFQIFQILHYRAPLSTWGSSRATGSLKRHSVVGDLITSTADRLGMLSKLALNSFPCLLTLDIG